MTLSASTWIVRLHGIGLAFYWIVWRDGRTEQSRFCLAALLQDGTERSMGLGWAGLSLPQYPWSLRNFNCVGIALLLLESMIPEIDI